MAIYNKFSTWACALFYSAILITIHSLIWVILRTVLIDTLWCNIHNDLRVAVFGFQSARSQNCEKWLWGSSCPSSYRSVRPSVCPPPMKNSGPTGRIFMIFDICIFFESLSRRLKFYENLRRITGSLHEDLRIFMITSLWVLLRMINVSYISCR
jgi:hypothetical protein